MVSDPEIMNGTPCSRGTGVPFTVGQGVPHKQNLVQRQISVVIAHARTNQMEDLLPMVKSILLAFRRIRPGQIVERLVTGCIYRAPPIRRVTPSGFANGRAFSGGDSIGSLDTGVQKDADNWRLRRRNRVTGRRDPSVFEHQHHRSCVRTRAMHHALWNNKSLPR